jgi:hypothetical protein
VADGQFGWEELAKFKAEGRFLDGYPDDQRTFFAPRDDVHGLLVALPTSAQHSIVVPPLPPAPAQAPAQATAPGTGTGRLAAAGQVTR